MWVFIGMLMAVGMGVAAAAFLPNAPPAIIIKTLMQRFIPLGVCVCARARNLKQRHFLAIKLLAMINDTR